MSEPVIVDKQPILLDLEPGTYYWCACGRSEGQPFCDGSHKETDITPVKFELPVAKKVALCQCKQTSGAPFCDGTHRTL